MDEQGIITTVRDTSILTVAATDEEKEACYDQTGFKMPPEILDDINCSVTSIPSEQESHDSTSSPDKEFSDCKEPATKCQSDDPGYEKFSSNDIQDSSEQALMKLLPNLVNELEKNGKLYILEKKFRLVNSKEFPMDNIAFLLWNDIVEFFDKKDSRLMRYNLFRVGRKLFGGHFIRFMSGMKNGTDLLLERGKHSILRMRVLILHVLKKKCCG